MAEKENLMFADPEIKPTDDLIFSIIGERKAHWIGIMEFLRQTYPGSTGEWNYYKDGKRWLFKMILKKKTLFWLAMLEKSFRISFWLSDKAIPLISESQLPKSIKDEFASAKKYGAIRAVSVIVNEHSDVENVMLLINLKLKIK